MKRRRRILSGLLVGALAALTSLTSLVSQGATSYGAAEPESKYLPAIDVLETNRLEFLGLTRMNIVGIEILAVSSQFDISSPAAWAGHSALRFVTDNQNPLLDPIVSFEMLTLNDDKVIESANNGAWPFIPRVSSLGDYLSRYSIGDGRVLKRIALPTSAEQRTKILQSIYRVMYAPALIGNYSYWSNNCATAILKILGMTGFSLAKVLVEVPSLLPSYLQNNLLAYTPPLQLRSFNDNTRLLVKQFRALARQPKTSLNTKDPNALFKNNSFIHFLEDDADLENVAYLIHFWPNTLKELESLRYRLLLAHRRTLKFFPPTYFIRNYPLPHYQTCELEDGPCRQSRLRLIQSEGLQNYSHLLPVASRYNSELTRASQLVPATGDRIRKHLMSPNVLDQVKLSQEIRALNLRK